MKKIKIYYQDRTECQGNVSETYRNAIRRIGVERVRALGIERNGINIISTKTEILNSSGKKESLSKPVMGSDGIEYHICTQFETESKYRCLCAVNEILKAGLRLSLEDDESAAEEEIDGMEGKPRLQQHIRRERNRKLRDMCLKMQGRICKACGDDLEKKYGQLGRDIIEVHHLVPISTRKGAHKVNALKDLVPLCPNCHSMMHRLPQSRMTVAELRKRIKIKYQ